MYMHIILKYFFYLFVCLEYWNSYFVLSFFSNYLCENFYIVGLSFEFKEEKYWTALNDVICKLISNKKMDTVRERIAWTIHICHSSAIGA